MITTREHRSAAFSGRRVACGRGRSLAAMVLLLVAGCAVEQDNSVARAARSRQVGALRAEREQLQRELAVLRQTEGEAAQAIVAADGEAVRTDARLRAVRTDLRLKLAQLQQSERDLAEVVARAQQIEVELQPLRALEQQLASREQRQAELAAALVAKDAELAALQAKVDEQQQQLAPRVQALQQQLAKAQQFAAALAQVEQQLAAAVAALVPPPAAAPAAPAAGQPAAPKPAASAPK